MPPRLSAIALLACLLLTSRIKAQEQPYERIQYHSYKWQTYHTPTFHLYFPKGYDSLAKFTVAAWPDIEKKVRQRMGSGHSLKDPQIILYPSVDQLYEINAGSSAPGQVTLPTIIRKGNRLLVPFTGSYSKLEDNLKLAIARSIYESWFQTSMLDQATAVVRQAEIPDWYKEGAIRYFALGWQEGDEYKITALLQVDSSNQIAAEESALWGAAFCYYLAQRYYPQAPQQLLFQVRKKKSLARATRLVTKRTLADVDSACPIFFRNRYTSDSTQLPDLPPLPKGLMRQVLVSADGEMKVVVVEKNHTRELWLPGKGNIKPKRIARYFLPPWINDYSSDPYPVLAANKDQLFVAAPRKGKLEVRMYTGSGQLSDKRALQLPDGLDELRIKDHNDWLLHAWRLGSDAFVHYYPQREKYHLADTNEYAHIQNQEHEVKIYSKAELLRLYQWDSAHQRLTRKQTISQNAESPWHSDQRKALERQAAEDSILNAARDTTQSFLSGVLNTSEKVQKPKDTGYNPKKVQPYVLQLYSAYFSAQVNNDYYINRYQPYQNYLGQFKFPEAGAQAKGGFSDLFENHHFSIAYRLPAGSEGSDFFVSYRNTKRRTDWGLTYFRKVEQLSPDPYRNWSNDSGKFYPNAGKIKTHYYEGNLHYPLNWYSAIDFSSALRYDRTIFVATDITSLRFEDLKQSWSVNTLAYSIDKRLPTLPGLSKGFYAKVGIDGFTSVSGEGGTTFGLYTKLEYHQPLYKGITLATRLQGGYSAGTGRILYNFGGTDGNLALRIDSDVHFKQDAPYVFQTLVTPFRGYKQNSLYGDRYALLNLDVYVPLFAELIDFKTPLSSINNLQLGLFTDIAAASENYKGVIKNSQNEWLYSVGFSARTILAGYPIRFDMGWPRTGGRPVWYLSIKY